MPALISDEVVETFAVQGAWGEIGQRIHARYASLLDRVTLYLPFVPGEQDEKWQAALTCNHRLKSVAAT